MIFFENDDSFFCLSMFSNIFDNAAVQLFPRGNPRTYSNDFLFSLLCIIVQSYPRMVST
jgi:hypothetical protein